jgi:dUTP pyrophosphatase
VDIVNVININNKRRNMMIDVYVERCRDSIEVLPTYANLQDSGMDIVSAVDIKIELCETVVIPTGLKMAIPKGYEIQIRPRSGISKNTPLRISNSPATIDSGYKDEIGILVTNTATFYEDEDDTVYDLSCKDNSFGAYQIHKGDRIAQIVLQEVPAMNLIEVDSVADLGYNRNGGFGSTGV